VLAACMFAAAAVAACRQDQPANDPNSEPNSPLPRVQRAKDDGSGKASKTTTTSESSSPGDADNNGEKTDAGK
jgi:hypothetical protein